MYVYFHPDSKSYEGNFVAEYFAEEDGIVIGRSSNPVASTGDRILHLGIIHDPSEPLPQAGHENY